MTPEERIQKVREIQGYESYELNEKMEYFGHYGKLWHHYYERAKKVYWYYQNLYSLSPSTDRQPVFKDMEEMVLWCQFHKMMKHKYTNPYEL